MEYVDEVDEFEAIPGPKISNKRKLTLGEILDDLTVDSATELAQLNLIQDRGAIVDLALGAELSSQLCDFNHYCSKTGKLIKENVISADSFNQMINILGKDKAIFATQISMISQIHPLWLFTDHEVLNELQLSDPYGYAAYCAHLILETYKENFDDIHLTCKSCKKPLGRHKKLNTTDYQWQTHLAKIRFFKQLELFPLPLIVNAGETFRRYLALLDTTKAANRIKWQTTNLLEICQNEDSFRDFVSNVEANLKRVIKYEFKAGHIRPDLIHADLIKLKNVYVGHSNMRLQRKAKAESEIDTLAREIESYFKSAGIDDNLLADIPMDDYLPQPKVTLNGKKVKVNNLTTQELKTFAPKLEEARLQQSGFAKAKTVSKLITLNLGNKTNNE